MAPPTSEQFAALHGTPAEGWKGGDVSETFPRYFRKTRRLSFEGARCDPDRIVYAHTRLREGRSTPQRFRRLAMSRTTSERFMAASKAVGYATVVPFRSPAERQHEEMLDRAEGQFAVIGDMIAPSRTGLNMGIEALQADMIGEEVLPVFIGGPDNRGYYPVFGNEKFQLIQSQMSMAGRANRSDFTPKYVTVDTAEHFHETIVTETERAAGVFLPTGIDTIKMQLLRNQMDLEEEAAQVGLIGDPANYITGNSIDASAGGNLHGFANQSADPISDISDWIEKVRRTSRQMPDTIATSPGPVIQLRRHGAIRQAIQYTGTMERPAAMVSLTALAELFMTRFLVGAAGYASSFGAALDDVWINSTYGALFAILCTGGGRIMSQRFGITASKPGFPKFTPYIDPTVGSTNATVYKYAKAWAVHLVENTSTAGKSSAGFLAYKVIS